jgi:3-oxoadipate enol-lactonase
MTTVSTKLGDIHVDDQGAADQPAALLWPSLFTDHRMWRHQVAALRAAGWRTLALDPPGHGRSPGPAFTFTMDECADAALAVLDAAAVREPVVILGTSWGGFVAPRVALRAPDRVRGMILFNTSADTPALLMKARLLTKLLSIGAIRTMVDRMAVATLLAPDTRKREPEVGAELQRELGTWNRPAVIRTVRSVLVDRGPVIDSLPGVRAPSLIVSGGKDWLLPTALSRHIVDKLPNARHVEVPNAAHLVPLEAPQTANSLILDFVHQLRHG